MCPACVASAASVAVGVTSAGGVMAMVVSLFRRKPSAKRGLSEQEHEQSKMQKEK
jgi:hypothetical protein